MTITKSINNKGDKTRFLKTQVPKSYLFINLILSFVYFFLLLFWFQKGDLPLYILLMLGEVFHLWQVIGYVVTIWDTEYQGKFDKTYLPGVDIYITACGEPVEIVEETVIAAKAMNYPKFKVYILNDGYVAKKDNWEDMEILAKKHGIGCITRKIPGGAKAGNINNALKVTKNPYIAIFDADQVPHVDFLRKMMGYFGDTKVAFVQSPQYYKNHGLNYVTGGAWEQQTLFFGPIQKGKNRLNSAFMCGTNMILKREAVDQVGGMCETNIAEDFLTSLFIHERGWKSIYVPKVLAEGLAPEDFLSYYKQQFRWTRGSLEVIFKYNPLFRKGLSFNQKFQYLTSASYYLSGLVVIMNALLPITFLLTGLVPLRTSTMSLALIFLPYIFQNLYNLQLSSNFSYTFRALSFSISSFYLQTKGIFAVLTNQKTKFAVTSKTLIEGNFLYLVIPNITYIILTIVAIAWGVYKYGISASVITNASWAILNAGIFLPFIIAAAPKFNFNFFTSSNLKVDPQINK